MQSHANFIFIYIIYVTFSSPDSWLYLLKFDNFNDANNANNSDNNATKHHVLMKS